MRTVTCRRASLIRPPSIRAAHRNAWPEAHLKWAHRAIRRSGPEAMIRAQDWAQRNASTSIASRKPCKIASRPGLPRCVLVHDEIDDTCHATRIELRRREYESFGTSVRAAQHSPIRSGTFPQSCGSQEPLSGRHTVLLSAKGGQG